MFWCSYEFSKFQLKKHTTGYLNINVQHMIAAATGEICQALVRNPFEVIKQNLQVGKYKNMLECGIDIFKHKSIGGFYSGYLSFIMREIPFSSIQFPFYEVLKLMQIKLIAYRTKQDENLVQIPSLVNGLNGSIAGSFSCFLVTPFDVAKTRLMTYNIKEKIPSTAHILKDVYHDEGLRGLYRGAGIRMVYLGVGGFAFFGIYEKIKLSLINKYE
jgi:solute carrier family 25 S-adenosylmethionine transporter 26